MYSCGLYLQSGTSSRRILSHGKLFVQQAQWSPDGSRIAYVIGTPRGGELRVVNADGSGDRLLLAETGELYVGTADWSWMRDGRHIIGAGGSGYQLLLRVDAAATNSYESLNTFAAGGWYATEVDASPTSDQVAVVFYDQRNQRQGIALLRLKDGALSELPDLQPVATLPWDGDDSFTSIDWAPDGKRLVLVHGTVDKSIGKGTTRVEIVDATPNGTPRALTDYPKGSREGAAYVESATFSPSGTWIAFKTVEGMVPKWEVIHPDGSGRAPFGALYGQIDWQPCQREPCSTVQATAAATRPINHSMVGVCGKAHAGPDKGTPRCYVLLGQATVLAVKNHEAEFLDLASGRIGTIMATLAEKVVTSTARSQAINFALKKMAGPSAAAANSGLSLGKMLASAANAAIIAVRWRDLGRAGYPPKCFHFQTTFKNSKPSLAFDPIWSFVRTYDSANPPANGRGITTSLAHWWDTGKTNELALPMLCRGANAQAVTAAGSSGLTQLLDPPYITFSVDFSQ